MHTKSIHTLKKTALALAVAATSFELHAQMLEEVVVTAQHREENLQDVPIAITAISSEELRTADVSDVNAISMRTPGFSMGSLNPAQPQLFIRGVGSNADGAGEDQSVVIFLDGVYLGRTSGQAFDLFDLERIEVLRGPQGTLYGKNAAGGALNIISQKPGEELEAGVEVSAGDLGYWGVRGKVSGPISDTVAGKLTFSRKERDGYVESLVADIDDFNDYESTGVRGQLRFSPSETVEMLLSADVSEDERNSPGRTPGDGAALGSIIPLLPASLQPDFYENLQIVEPHADTESRGLSLQIDWDVAGGTFTSITAYRESEADVLDFSPPADIAFFPIAVISNTADEDAEQLSQEFRFATETSDSLFWQAGVFFMREKTERTELFNITLGPLFPTGPGFVFDLPQGGNFQENETDSVGIFGQGTWTFSDQWDLTVGARYTSEEKDASNRGIVDGLAVLEPFDVEADESWSAFTPKLALNYRFGDDLTAYATISTGFKSGGFQGSAPTAVAATTPFDEEQVLNAELGLKGTILDGSLRFSATLFSMAYEDLQLIVQTALPGGIPGPLLTTNAGEADSRGIEMEFQWQLSEYWQLAGTYAYLDTEYTELDGSLAPFEGNRLRNAPKNAGSLSAIFSYPMDSGARIDARADYTRKTRAEQDVENREFSAIEPYEVTNVRLAYTTANDQWEITGWVKNVFDEEYMLHNFALNPGISNNPTPAAPRTSGVTATWRF